MDASLQNRYKIGKIRDFLDRTTTERLVHAFVMCHFDFCNSLLFGLPSQQIQRLQLIQNSAARLVTRTKKHDSISSVLRNLHWLPIQSRINFKVLLFAYQCVHQFGPSYLVELLTQYKPERTLRLSKKSLFCVPQTMTRSYGERSFSYAAPVLWNNLPEHVRNIDTYERFKTSLKTHLFDIYIIYIIIYYIYIALNTMFLSALQINVLLPRLCPASLI